MPDDPISAALAPIRERAENDRMRTPNVTVRRLLAAVDAALSHHKRYPLYGNAATEGEPGNCPHHPDSDLHFEADDGSGEWLCEGRPEGAVCESCIDGEGGERLEWPCAEYENIIAALTGKEKAGG